MDHTRNILSKCVMEWTGSYHSTQADSCNHYEFRFHRRSEMLAGWVTISY